MRRTVATKSSDGKTNSDKWYFPLSWPVAWDSPSGVKGALKGHLGLVYHAQSPHGGVKQLTNKTNRGILNIIRYPNGEPSSVLTCI